jgi:dolichyl-phosphate beta-glucosyltransferase
MPKSHPTDLTVLVPAFNEEKIIKHTLEEIVAFLRDKKYSWEIVVADDGSSDGTGKIVKSVGNKKIRLVDLKENKGKGGALREGVKAATGDCIIFMDADLSVPLINIDKFLASLKNGSDVVIGSRRTTGAKIAKHQPWLRENMGRVYTALTRVVTGVPLSDFTCGFKGFTSTAGKKIFAGSVVDRWSYDAEIMFLAKKYGFNIKEVPVKWFNREDSRVRLGSAVFTSFSDLVKIRAYDRQGKYDA